MDDADKEAEFDALSKDYDALVCETKWHEDSCECSMCRERDQICGMIVERVAVAQ